MARSVRTVLRLNYNALTNNVFQRSSIDGSRLLYSAASLGLDNYNKTRSQVQNQFHNMTDKFRAKMLEFVDENSNNMIFTEDLKSMVHLVETNPDDIELIMKMMRKFNVQNKELRFGSFIFGPVVMRAFHTLDQPDAALSAFKDPALEGFFDQLISYHILLDLLFNHQRYEDMHEVFELVKAKYTDGARTPRHSVVLIFAAYYKQNTPESLKNAVSLWKELKERGHIPMRRAYTFMAGLALNQGAPHITVEVISALRQINYITIKNLKVAALADLDRIDDIVPFLRGSLTVDDPSQRKQTYLADVIEKVEAAMERAKVDENSEISKLLNQLKRHNHIIKENLDSHLTAEIHVLPKPQEPNQGYRDRQMLAASYRSDPRENRYSRPQRPGLRDLV